MFSAQLRRAARLPTRQLPFKRRFASNGPSKTDPGTEQKLSRTRARLDKWISRSPNFFKPTLRTLRDAPASYIVSFAILHELTAIVPLFGLAYAFHYFQWLPSYFAEGKWMVEGVEKFGRYFKRKGWIQESEKAEVEADMKSGSAGTAERGDISSLWSTSEGARRWLIEFAAAYAVVKVLIPVRIALSVWWAPGFAKFTLVPISRAFHKGWRRLSRSRGE